MSQIKHLCKLLTLCSNCKFLPPIFFLINAPIIEPRRGRYLSHVKNGTSWEQLPESTEKLHPCLAVHVQHAISVKYVGWRSAKPQGAKQTTLQEGQHANSFTHHDHLLVSQANLLIPSFKTLLLTGMTLKTNFQILKPTSIISESSTTSISLGRSGKNAVVKTLNGKPLLAIISRDNEHLAKKARAALLGQLDDVGAKELKRSCRVVQCAETFLLGVPSRRTGKGTVLIAIAGLHFPTGLDRISTAAFAFLKGRPEKTADVGNLWASQGGNRRTWKTNQGLCQALWLPTAEWPQRRKRQGQGEQGEEQWERGREGGSKWATAVLMSTTGSHHLETTQTNPLVPWGTWRNFLSQQEACWYRKVLKNPRTPKSNKNSPKQINKIAQVCYPSPHFAQLSQGCCSQSVLAPWGKKMQSVSFLLP